MIRIFLHISVSLLHHELVHAEHHCTAEEYCDKEDPDRLKEETYYSDYFDPAVNATRILQDMSDILRIAALCNHIYFCGAVAIIQIVSTEAITYLGNEISERQECHQK